MVLKKRKFKSNLLYKKLLGILNKKGLKKKAKYILDFALSKVSYKLNIKSSDILVGIFLKLNTFVEVKKIFLRKRVLFVPFYASIERRLFLIAKWLFLGALVNKKKIKFKYKLLNEILLLLTNKKKSKAFKIKKLNIKKALQNRANTHYRW
jgi:ribosomal protein S7